MTRRRMVAAGSKSKIQLSGASRQYRGRHTQERMKEIFNLPEPKNKGIIKQIIGPKGANLRHLEKTARIKPYDIRQKKNEVHIIGTEEQVEIVRKMLREIIDEELKRQDESKDDKVVPLPQEKIGWIMGTDGSTIKRIEIETNTTIYVKDKAAHIKGSEINKKQAALKIQEIAKKCTPSTEGKIKVALPPNCELGRIVGHKFSNIEQIKEETEACIEVIGDAIYVSGEDISNCKRAIIKIKSKAADVCNKKPVTGQFNFLHATDSECPHYKLQEFDCPNSTWNGEKHFKVYKIDEEEAVDSPKELNAEELQKFVCEELKKVQQENKDKEVKVELFCHFGHLYIGNIDEGDQEKAYKLSDLKKEFKKDRRESWRLRFNPAIKDLEFKELEKTLRDHNKDSYKVDPHIRHDFQFYTPYCTNIRAKMFMDMDGNIDATFSDRDIDIKKHDPPQVSVTSQAPKYMLCDQFQIRARVNIMILSKGMDCRLAIRTVSTTEDKDGKAKEFEKNVTEYLDKVSFDNKEVCMPEDSEMPGIPGDYCLHYWRKCHRRSYPYEVEREEFSITISEEDVMDVTGSGKKEPTKTDIHLHCDEWDRLLTSGKWEPEQIVEKLPQFINFVKDVQSSISGPHEEKYE